ncbi:hypothetical protein MM213_05695, partial [Belliella sp. R4-6]|nr:hypothetical protein [Belliella alkalica]
MRKIYKSFQKYRLTALAVVFLLFGLNVNNAFGQNQNVKPFLKRVGTPQPPNGVFNVKGDYSLLGNTNLTLQSYGDETNNSNNQMIYVDVDGVPQTVNSSSASLVFSQENGADPNCSEILYAGLYWSGRATPGIGNTFNVTKGEVPGVTQNINQNQTLSHSNDVNFSSYNMTVSRQGVSSQRYPRYVFSGDGNTYTFDYTNNSGTNRVQFRVGNGVFVDVPVTLSNGSGLEIATLVTPFTFTDGGVTITINSLTRDTRTNLTQDEYRGSSRAAINILGTFTPMIPNTVSLDKRKVKIKGPASSTYTELTANSNNILYPNGSQADMYAGYVDVTNYVRANGLGEYTVADIALTEGNGGTTGYYGHWAIIVVYENSKMPWRDITIFDGYSFVQAATTGTESAGEFTIDGFNSVQNGPVKFKLGVLAGEGDRGITGDFLQIRNAANTNWVGLTHPQNTTNNFFNSSIYTPVPNASGTLVQPPRTPNLLNNTGIDIAMWDVPNPNNNVIANNQTSTRFRYGTTQDLYAIYMVAFAVDAYVPDVEALNQLTGINGNSVGGTPELEPGQTFTYKVDIRNRGTEAVNDLELVIPIPFTANFTGNLSDLVTQINFSGGNAQAPFFDPTAGSTGSIIWKINDLPLPPSGDPNEILATLTYTLKGTENCFILAQQNCEAFVEVSGILRGKGATSQSTFNAVPFVTGYSDQGSCVGEPISEPLRIPIINAIDWVQNNCQGETLELEFFFCNVSAGIPVSEIRGNFPIGTRFFGGPDPLNDIEYNENNPFPAAGGQFYAIPPNSSECIFQFDIIVTIVTTNPDVPSAEDLTFCQGENAGNLSQFISLSTDGIQNNYQLFFFTQQSGGNSISNPIINTNNPGQVTFWVAEGPSSGCIGDRVPVTITITPKSTAPLVQNTVECQSEGTIGYDVTALSGATLLYYSDNNPSSLPFETVPVVNLSQSGVSSVWVSQISAGECESERVLVNVTINPAAPLPVSSGNITECATTSIQTLDARDAISTIAGVTYRWYDSIEGLNEVTPTLSAVGTVTFYVEAVSADGCASLERTPVTLTINDCRVAITKTVASGQEQINAPTTLNYTINVTNPGNTPLTGVVVTDPLTNNTTPLSLASGDTNGDGNLDTNETWVYNASFVVTQAIFDLGDAIVNTAFVNTAQTGEEEASVTTTISGTSSISIDKSASQSSYVVDDVITYTFRVENTGDFTLSNVNVVDALPGLGAITQTSGTTTLAPNGVAEFTATYTITQSDVDAGSVENTATATGTPPTGSDVTNTDTETITVDSSAGSSISIDKSASQSSYVVDDVITYTFRVENTGDFTLSNVNVVDA